MRRLGLLAALAAAACGSSAPEPGTRTLRTARDEFGLITCSGRTAASTCYTNRAILGVSMGAGGAGQLGFARPELFDTVGMLGIPIVDWVFMLRNVKRAYLAGFCDRETILANLDRVDDPTGPAYCGPAPAVEELVPGLMEPEQDFNHMHTGPLGGGGGVFGRNTLRESFRDLSAAFGNATTYNPESTFLPPGVTEAYLARPAAERCAEPAVVRGFFDVDHNPDGSADVITMCDTLTDEGDYDPTRANEVPHEVLLAVDYNGNGRRDWAEPIIAQVSERYQDVGNDPGDDYDWASNPAGRAGNWRYDEGEPFDDHGLDGVPGTGDHGEGNGTFDYNPNTANYLAQNPRGRIEAMDETQLARLNIWADAGIRDFLVSAGGMNWLWGSLRARAGADAKDYTRFDTLLPGESEYDFLSVDYAPEAIGRHAYLRYGDPNASQTAIDSGDGNHVGTGDQILNRLLTAMSFAEARFLDRDKRQVDSEQNVTELISTRTFYSAALGEDRRYGLMLPPGYDDPENADRTYPVIYFLHGQAMGFNELLASGILYFGYMAGSAREETMRRRQSDWAKMLLVFPDSLCAHGECVQGNFNANFAGGGPRYQDALFELMAHVEATYRVAPPVEVAR